ncbi:MAG: DUF2914 domain-containing protein [Chitinispirillaceae bacterium]|nr:DUF2914 domain-containing protein [Chitinispirillaceae bacterium]
MRLLSAILFSSLIVSISATPARQGAPKAATTDTASAKAAPGTQKTATRPNSLGLTVPFAVIAKGIDDSRNPIEPGTEFSTDVQRVYCITQIKGVKTSATIEHRWYKNDELACSIELPVKSVMWRTQSYKTITPGMAGKWKVDVVLMPGEEILTTLRFSIQ